MFRTLLLSAFSCMLPGTMVLVLGFFAILHSWLNAWAEMTRFADRMFYKVSGQVYPYRSRLVWNRQYILLQKSWKNFLPPCFPSLHPSFLLSSLPPSHPSFLPSFLLSLLPSLPRSFLPSLQPSFLPSFLLFSLPSFLPSFLPPFLPFLPSFPSSLPPSFLPSLPPSFLPSFPPSLLPSFHPSFLPSFLSSFFLSFKL